MNSTEKPAQAEGGLRIDLAGKVVEVRIDSSGTKPPQLIEINERNLAKHDPVSVIEIRPSQVDPKVIVAIWPFQKGFTYALFILDEGGRPLFQSPASPASSQIIPIASIEEYIGKTVRAFVVWSDHKSGARGVLPDKWFQPPKPAAPFVWNFEEKDQQWVRRHKKRQLFTWRRAELALLLFLTGATLLGLYFLSKMPPSFHL